MNIIAVDDEQAALASLERAIRMADAGANIACFRSPREAQAYAQSHRIDVAFLDIEMREMSGLFLAKHLKALSGGTNIIFVTGFMQYAINAHELHVSGYVMKPINPRRVREELDNLRSPPGEDVERVIKHLGPYTFEHTAKRVFVNGRDALLTPREYVIFHFLASHPGVYFTPQQLYEKTAGLTAGDDVHALYPHISRLRKKLGLDDAEATIHIEQSRGKGYRLVVD